MKKLPDFIWRRSAAVFSIFLLCCSTALAQTSDVRQDGGPWWVRTGAAWVAFDENAELQAGGQPVLGANANVKNNAAFLAEFGYRFAPNISLGLTVGYPPTTTLTGNGSVTSLGAIGKVKYGPAALTLQYQFDSLVQYNLYPYVGVGVTYLKVFSSTDGSVTNFQARSAWGGLAQVGLEYRITRRLGLFVDFKKFIVRTSAVGNLGPTPVHA